MYNFNPTTFARWLVILELVVMLFSPPLTNLVELSLFILFIGVNELRKRFMSAIKQPMVAATLVFYLILLIDTTYSIAPWKESLSSFWGWRKIMLLPIAVALFDEEIWKQKLIFVFIKISTACSLISFLSKFLQFQIHNYPAGIIIRNHATQGIMFSIAAFATVIMLTSSPNIFSKKQKYIFSSFILILVSNVIYITPGRSGYLALVILVLAFVFFYAKTYKKISTPFVILALIPLLLLSSTNVRQRISQGVSETESYKSNAEATSMGIRMVLWNNTFELIRERPLLGYGTGGFQNAYKAKVANGPLWKQNITHDPHNQFLKITAEQGLIGLVFFVGMIISFFWQKVEFDYRVLGIGVLLVWCSNSLFSSHFSTFTEGRFVYLWCGVMLASASLNKFNKSPVT